MIVILIVNSNIIINSIRILSGIHLLRKEQLTLNGYQKRTYKLTMIKMDLFLHWKLWLRIRMR